MVSTKKIAFALILCLLCISLTGFVVGEEEQITPKFNDGELFRKEVFTIDGEVSSLTGKTTLVILSFNGCGSCMGLLQRLEPIIAILGNEFVDIRFLWPDKIPEEISETPGIGDEHHFSMLNTGQELDFWPGYYILDENGYVISSHENVEDAFAALLTLDIFDKDVLKNRCIEYFYNNVIVDPQKPQLIYFSMTGCPDCAKADEMIEENGLLFNEVEINRIYRHGEADPQKMRDDFSLFKFAFDISWYPSFLLMTENDVVFIGKEPIELVPEIMLEYLQ